MLLEMALQDLTRRNIKWLLTQLEYHFESKQISFYSNLVKVFHLPEFPGKIILFAKLSGWFLERQPLKSGKQFQTGDYLPKEFSINNVHNFFT